MWSTHIPKNEEYNGCNFEGPEKCWERKCRIKDWNEQVEGKSENIVCGLCLFLHFTSCYTWRQGKEDTRFAGIEDVEVVLDNVWNFMIHMYFRNEVIVEFSSMFTLFCIWIV